MTLYDLLTNLLPMGITERPGNTDHPYIVWAFERAGLPGAHDELSWCGAGLGLACDFLGLETPVGRAHARNWLTVGEDVTKGMPVPGDVLVLKRGGPLEPGPENLAAPGHVTCYAGFSKGVVMGLGMNQSNRISLAPFPLDRILGIRRLASKH